VSPFLIGLGYVLTVGGSLAAVVAAAAILRRKETFSVRLGRLKDSDERRQMMIGDDMRRWP
jgi:hypothetical protein